MMAMTITTTIGTAVAMAMVRVWFDREGIGLPLSEVAAPDSGGDAGDTEPPGAGAVVGEAGLVADCVVMGALVNSPRSFHRTGMAGAQISESRARPTKVPSVYVEVMVEESGWKQLPVSAAGSK